MPVLTREMILNAPDIKREEVDMSIHGWPGSVFVQSMTGIERGRFEAMLNQTEGEEKIRNWERFRALMLVYCVVDGNGNRIFNDDADIDALNSKNAGALDFLYDRAQKLSGFRKTDIDEMTKNSSKGQSAGSSSD